MVCRSWWYCVLLLWVLASLGRVESQCQNATRFADVVPLCAEYLNNYAIQGGLVRTPHRSYCFSRESLHREQFSQISC